MTYQKDSVDATCFTEGFPFSLQSMGSSPSKNPLALYKLSPKRIEEMKKENKKVASTAAAVEQLFPLLSSSDPLGQRKMQAYRFWKVSREYSGLFRALKKRRDVALCLLDDDSLSGLEVPRQLDIVDACLAFLHAFFPTVSFERVDDDMTILPSIEKSRVRAAPLQDLRSVHLYNTADLFPPLKEKFGVAEGHRLACVAVLPRSDLYPDTEGSFALGMSSVDAMAAVCCLGRSKSLPDSAEAILWLLVKVIAHELCHLFGLDHCGVFHCLLNDSVRASEAVEALPLWLCPFCLCKLRHLLEFSTPARYRGLLEALRSREIFKLHPGFAQAIEHYERILQSDVFSHRMS